MTVFGFEPPALSFVLRQFQTYGDILSHRVTKGNWVHLEYDDENGKKGGGRLIGSVSFC